MIGSIQSWLLHLHGPVVYIVIGLLVGVEAAVLVGFVVPAELATVIGGVIASQHRANVVVMIVVVATMASVGNVVGYELGRLIGPWLMDHRPLRGNLAVARTEKLICEHGAPAVFFGRWIIVVRALVPGVAGLSAMSRRLFISFATPSAVLWSITWVLVGYAAGASYGKLVNAFGQWSLVILVAVLVVAAAFIVWHHLRRRRRDR
jgi:membrane-associated protein